MKNKIQFTAIRAQQSSNHEVLSFSAKASQIEEFASIDRINRDESGQISGFQRPQITNHIHEIRDYLSSEDAVLPNPIVVAFIDSVEVNERANGVVDFVVDLTNGKPGLVVDGQQRLTALAGLPEKDFQVFVSALVCRDERELRKQFILINNTRPLPKSLIYELLPGVEGLPERMSSRSVAAKLTEALNYEETSSLRGKIKQHTNPDGVIADNPLQRLIMNSLADGACRNLMEEVDGQAKCFELISEFFEAVQNTFPEAWEFKTPKNSRLVHGAGIVSMGYVLEFLHARDGACKANEFEIGMAPLLGKTAWTHGDWHFGENEVRPWNGLQNLHRDIQMLASYMTRILKHAEREKIVTLKAANT